MLAAVFWWVTTSTVAVTGSAPAANPGPTIFEQNDGRGLPNRTFADRMTLKSGADQIDLHYFGRGHTNGDAWVLFPAVRVVHAGDIFAWNNRIPFVDASNGGSGVELPDTLTKAHTALSKSADVIITGHSAVMNFEDLSRWAEFNRDFLNAMRQAKQAGRSVEEAAKMWTPPAEFDAPQEARLLGNIHAIYSELP